MVFPVEIQAFLTKPLILLRFCKDFVESAPKTVSDYSQKPMVFYWFYNKNENLSDVRTGRAFWGSEHDARLSCVLCMCDVRG